MIVAETRAALREVLGGTRARSDSDPADGVSLVATMGALHAGHARLLDVAAARSRLVVASIFVNPLQFGPAEDLSRYPRSREADFALCSGHGVDVVFAPSVAHMYPDGEPTVTLDPGPLGDVLEGASRPGHFRGVLTVVAKLFGLIRPDAAFFGDKDYQQLVAVTRLVADLCMPVDVRGVETVRDADGLALSSRNRYLSPTGRRSALSLSRALRAGEAAAHRGPRAVLAAAERVLAAEPGVVVDYLSLRATDLSADPVRGGARLLVAGRVGATRLIDNVALELAGEVTSFQPDFS